MFKKENGIAHILILITALGILVFLLISNTFSFKDKLFNALFPKPPSHAAEQAPSVPDEILLKFKPGVPEKAKENIRNSHGIKVEEVIEQIDVERGKVPAEAKDRIIEALKKNPQIEFAEPNFLGKLADTPNDPLYIKQWHHPKIGSPAAWDITHGSSASVIAIVDSGVESTHDDLKGNLMAGYNFYDNNTDTSDVNGHGTLVAGTTAAQGNNAIGVAGLCYACRILPLKVTTPPDPITSQVAPSSFAVAKSLNYARGCDTSGANCGNPRARVANLSMGLPFSNTVQDAINNAWVNNMIIVAAVGNETASSIAFPASGTNVVAVGATNDQDLKAIFSNTGPGLDVGAPGIHIQTTMLGNTYISADGTSFSSPLVAGLAGLILSADSGLTNQQVVDIINQTADKIDSTNHPYTDLTTNNCNGWNSYYGCGRINAAKALQKATGITPPPVDTTAPTTSITSPTSGVTISGIVDITANASDNVGVTKVEFYIDGGLLGSTCCPSSSGVYVASWDTTTISNTSHTISVKAYDLANNVGTSSSVTVTVSNAVSTPTPAPSPSSTPAPSDTTPPTVSITNPLNGATVKTSSKVNITASASDNVAVTKVEFYVGNTLKCSVLSGPYSCTWSVPGRKNTSYTIQAKAYDPSNNTNTSSITVKAQ